MLAIEEDVVLTCSCCSVVGIHTQCAITCPRAGAQMNQHQPLLHATARTVRWMGVPPSVESGELFTVGINKKLENGRKYISENEWDAPSRDAHKNSILSDSILTGPQARVNLRGGSAC